MKYSVIFCYKVDSEGQYNEETDILGIKVLPMHLDTNSAIESGVLDDVFTELEVGTHVKFEIFNVEFTGVNYDSGDSLSKRIQEDMVSMIQDGELNYVNDFQFYATVNENVDSYFEQG